MEYKVQLVVGNGWREDKDVYCTCGHHRKVEYNVGTGACPECETTKVHSAYPRYDGTYRYVDNLYKVIEKDDRGFHVKRQEFHILLNKNEGTVTATPKNTGEISYSLKDKVIHLTRNGKKLYANDSNVNTFFKGASKGYILKAISTPKNSDLFDFCYNRLSCMGYERSEMWGRGLTRLKDYPAVEVFGLSLMSSRLSDLWNYYKSMMSTKTVTAPHKMLGVPKFMISYMNNMHISSYNMDRIKKLIEYFDGNSVKMIFEIFDDESNVDFIDDVAEKLVELHRDYNYKNLRRTVLYITREVKLEQGITHPDEALGLLRDYARMSQAMGVEHAPYSKSLKKDHDIALINYKTKESEIKQKEFAKVIDYSDYAELDFKGKDFSIVRPTHVKDVINEGDSLSHCVASYVDDIIKKKCKILFLRNTQNLDESLVTVEIRGKSVRQVRGRFNRKASTEESAFVQTWAKKKNLEVSYY
jgi:hypothetical protein